MSKSFEQYHEMSKKISESLVKSMFEMQNRIAEITIPFADFQKRLQEMMREILVSLTKLSAQIEAISKLGENQLIWFSAIDEGTVKKLLSSYRIADIFTEHWCL